MIRRVHRATPRRAVLLLGAVAALLSGCSRDTPAPDSTRSIARPAPANDIRPSIPDSPEVRASAAADSIRWAAEEAALFATRKRAMGSYASCIAQTRGLPAGASRDAIVRACGNLPGAPKAR